jgi:hypothetical protein
MKAVETKVPEGDFMVKGTRLMIRCRELQVTTRAENIQG